MEGFIPDGFCSKIIKTEYDKLEYWNTKKLMSSLFNAGIESGSEHFINIVARIAMLLLILMMIYRLNSADHLNAELSDLQPLCEAIVSFSNSYNA